MNRNAIAVVIGLSAAAAALAIVLLARHEAPPGSPAADPAVYFDQSAETDVRIRALEAAVAEERNARLLLEDELQAIYARIEEIDSAEPDRSDERDAALAGAVGQREAFIRQRARDDDARYDRLVEGGFSPERAEWLLQRESELQMEAMQAMYRMRQTGERPDSRSLDPSRALREELGDAEYEKYLDAYGMPTSVEVGSVLESSPGQRAGLQVGDQITGYGGQRVFSMQQLRELTMQSEPGRSIVVDIVRDGAPMQIVVDSGPIGFSTGQFRPRR